ncbi:MAG: radical SAM protein, partial [Candidatus Eisenbacteria bacterium]
MRPEPSTLAGPAAPALREPGAILLISCYELGRQPLGVAVAGAFLRRAGFAPAALDLSVEPFDAARVARAGLVVISVPMHTALRLGLRAAAQVRAVNPGTHVCFHGLYAGLNAAWLMEHGADSAIGGESEGPLVALAEALTAGRPAAVAGASVPGRVAPPHLARLDFPAPARELLPPLARYARIERDGRFDLAGSVEASRGCRHRCLHCPIPPAYDGRFFVVPAEVVLADVRHQVAMGATHITFADPDFLNAPTHALRIVRALHAEFPVLSFDLTTKIEHVLEHRALMPELAACGALFVVSAVESLSDTVLAHLEKGHTRADVFAALGILRQAGIALRPSLVSFTP